MAVHLLCSAFVVATVWLSIQTVWYPPPLGELAGGTAIFVILACVDVVVGPALTGVVASPTKPRAEFKRDIGIILMLQLGAMLYGLHTLAQARPVAIAFEVDQFRLVTLPELDIDALASAPEGLRKLPWTGPLVVAAERPSDPAEQLRTIELGLAGMHLAALPQHWRDYTNSFRAQAWAAGQSLPQFAERSPLLRDSAEKLAARAGVSLQDLRVLPLMARRSEAMVVIASPDARIVGYLPAH